MNTSFRSVTRAGLVGCTALLASVLAVPSASAESAELSYFCDFGVGETEDALSALAHARREFGESLPLVLAGFSFGTYVQTRVAERVTPQRMVLVGPAVKRFAVGNVPADTIVIHGEQDEVVALADVLDWARPQELPVVVFPGCTHFFHGRLPQLSRVITGMWCARCWTTRSRSRRRSWSPRRTTSS